MPPNVIEGDLIAESIEALNDSLVPVVPSVSQSGELGLERSLARLEEVHKHVDLCVAVINGQLNTWDEAQAEVFGGQPCAVDPVERVVIHQGSVGQACASGERHHLFG